MKRQSKDIHPKFDNEWVDKSKATISISAALGQLGEEFDQKSVAQKTHDKHYNNPDSEYWQKSVEQIIEMWENKGKVSRSYGCKLDDYIGYTLNDDDLGLEMYKLQNNFDFDERLKAHTHAFDEFIKWFESHYDVEYVDREVDIYYKMPKLELSGQELDYYVRGRLDALFYNKANGHYIVIDWKSSGSIDTQPTKWTTQLAGPANKWPSLNWYTYSMQVNFYKMGLIQNYLPENTEVDVLIVNLPDHPFDDGLPYRYYVSAMPYCTKDFEDVFAYSIKMLEIKKKMAERNKNKKEEE